MAPADARVQARPAGRRTRTTGSSSSGGAAVDARRGRAADEREAVDPLLVDGGERGRASRARPSPVARQVVSNTGDAPLSGQVTADGAGRAGRSRPRPPPFGPIAGGASQTVTFNVTVPAGTEPGSYPIAGDRDVEARDRRRRAATVHVVGDVIEFTPFTPAEEPWLFDADGSQLRRRRVRRQRALRRQQRATSPTASTIRADVTGGTLTLDILHPVPRAGVERQPELGDGARGDAADHRRLEPRRRRELDLNDLAEPGETLYVRIADSFPDDGWGGWLGAAQAGARDGVAGSLVMRAGVLAMTIRALAAAPAASAQEARLGLDLAPRRD